MGAFIEVQRPPAPINFPPCMTINPQLIHLAGGLILGQHWVQNRRGGPRTRLLHQVCPCLEAWSNSQAALVTYSETHTNMYTRTFRFFNFFSLPECLTNLSVRACQSIRAQ